MTSNDNIECDEEKTKKVSDSTMLVNLITVGLGAGILAQPWAVAGASIIPSIAITAVVLLLNFGSIMILVIEAEKTQVFDLGNLIGLIPGRMGTFGKIATNIVIWLVMILALISYIIVIDDSLEPLLPTTGIMSKRWVLNIICGVILSLLCLIPQKYLSFTSTLSVIMNVYIFGVLIAETANKGLEPDVCWAGFNKGTVVFFSAMMYTMVIQMIILPMYAELNNRTPRRFGKLLAVSFVFLFFLFSAFSSVAYLAYGPKVSSNVLNNLTKSVSGTVGRIGMLLVVAGVYPMVFLPIISPVISWQEDRRKTLVFDGHASYHSISELYEEEVERDTGCRWFCRKLLMPVNFASLFIAASVITVAIFVEKLGNVVSYAGAVSVIYFVGFTPAVIGLCLSDLREQLWFRIAMWLLLLLSFAMGIMGCLWGQNNYYEALEGEGCLLRLT